MTPPPDQAQSASTPKVAIGDRSGGAVISHLKRLSLPRFLRSLAMTAKKELASFEKTPNGDWMRNAPLKAVWGVALGWTLLTGLNIVLMPPRYAPHASMETVKRAPLELIVRAGGTLEPKRSVAVKAEFDGPVLKKLFKDGDKVRQGQLLLVLGKENIRLDYERALNDYKNARSDLAKARRDAAIQKQLYRRQAVPFSSVEDAQRAAVRASQALGAAREAFLAQDKRWASDRITAPFDGTIIKDNLGEEQKAAAGKEIAVLADPSEYVVSMAVDELEIGQVREGQRAEVQLQAYGSQDFHAAVTRVGAMAEGSAVPEVPVTLTLEKAQGMALKPGLTAVARVLTGRTAPTLTVPLSAITNTGGETAVWILGPFHRLRPRKVATGQSNPDRVEITQGLKEGDRVCITADPHYARGIKVIVDAQ